MRASRIASTDADDLDDYYALFVFDPDGIRVEVFAAKQAEPGQDRWTTK